MLSADGATLLDYTLEWLSRMSLVHKVLLCCTPKYAKRVKLYCRFVSFDIFCNHPPIYSRWSSVFASIACIECPDAHCTADCVRELDRRSMIAGDFLLTSAGAMCVGDLMPAIEQYR
jgi:2-C-methyl-D-erythritol 4-phosphate cytidylyltransferase